VDTSGTYNELCQLFLCYVIEFSTAKDITPGSIKVVISNMLNPESVQTTKDVEVTTLMKYASDTIFYKIDAVTVKSNYQAVAGEVDPAKMSVTSLTNDLSTAAVNQQYQLQFTSKHAVSKGGFIKVNLPPTFGFSSVSSTLAQFNVLHTPPPATPPSDPSTGTTTDPASTDTGGSTSGGAARRRLAGHGQSYAGIFAVD
jgi:hypothetical protein